MRLHNATRIYIIAVTLASFTAFSPANAFGDEVKECTAARQLAKVGHYSWDTVNVTADEDNEVCSFSINGATVDSPPQEDVIEALRSFLGTTSSPGSFFGEEGFFAEEEIDTDALALLLLASSPITQIDEMSWFLSEYRDNLIECKRAMRDVDMNGPYEDDSFGSFFCGVYPQNSVGRLYSFGPISGVSRIPVHRTQIVIGARPHYSLWHLVSFSAR